MSKTMMKKGFSWLLLAACLLTLLLPWMKLNANGTTLWELTNTGVPTDVDLERQIREAIADLADEAAEEGYALDAEELSFTVIRALHGNLRLWEIPRMAAATSNFIPALTQAVDEAVKELEEEAGTETGSYYSYYYEEYGRMLREVKVVLEELAERYSTEALLYWIFLGLTLAGLVCAAVCIARGKRWGCSVFFAAALALFVLNLVAVCRNNAFPEKLLSVIGRDELPPGLMNLYADFYHIGAASVCCLIFAALLALHARFDLIGLASRLSLRPKEAPAEPAPEPTAEETAPAAPAAEPTEEPVALEPSPEPEPSPEQTKITAEPEKPAETEPTEPAAPTA